MLAFVGVDRVTVTKNSLLEEFKPLREMRSVGEERWRGI